MFTTAMFKCFAITVLCVLIPSRNKQINCQRHAQIMFELYDLLANWRVGKIGCLQVNKKLHFTDNWFYAY